MAFLSSMAMSSLFGYPSAWVVGRGRMRGPPLLTRIDLAPRIFPASSHFLATAMPALRFSGSGSQMSRGALFEMCWHVVPVAFILSAILEPALAGFTRRIELARHAHLAVGSR